MHHTSLKAELPIPIRSGFIWVCGSGPSTLCRSPSGLLPACLVPPEVQTRYKTMHHKRLKAELPDTDGIRIHLGLWIRIQHSMSVSIWLTACLFSPTCSTDKLEDHARKTPHILSQSFQSRWDPDSLRSVDPDPMLNVILHLAHRLLVQRHLQYRQA